MEGYSTARKPGKKIKNTYLNKAKLQPSANDQTTFIWCNSAFMHCDDDDGNDLSSVGSTNTVLQLVTESGRKGFVFSPSPVNEEELRLREELACEIEKELERELMEGILILVRRLSDLKAKQIARGLEDMSVRDVDEWCSNLSCGIPALDAYLHGHDANGSGKLKKRGGVSRSSEKMVRG